MSTVPRGWLIAPHAVQRWRERIRPDHTPRAAFAAMLATLEHCALVDLGPRIEVTLESGRERVTLPTTETPRVRRGPGAGGVEEGAGVSTLAEVWGYLRRGECNGGRMPLGRPVQHPWNRPRAITLTGIDRPAEDRQRAFLACIAGAFADGRTVAGAAAELGVSLATLRDWITTLRRDYAGLLAGISLPEHGGARRGAGVRKPRLHALDNA